MIIHLETDKLNSEVKRTLGSITTNKTRQSDEIPAELFKILQDDAVKSAALNMLSNLENSAVAIGLEKVTFHSTPNKSDAKGCSNHCTIVLIPYSIK